MKITLDQVGKHFNFNWIFRKVNYAFEAPSIYAITGNNGSGKSTLLQIISGFLSPSSGTLGYYHYNGAVLSKDTFYQYLTLTTPHLELLEELTLEEQLKFQNHFKNPLNGMDSQKIMGICGLRKHRNKPLKYFSSGMLQRVRLALTLLFESHVVLLDEPTSHLDRNGIEWYKYLIKGYQKERLIIISSNIQEEHDFADHVLSIGNFA